MALPSVKDNVGKSADKVNNRLDGEVKQADVPIPEDTAVNAPEQGHTAASKLRPEIAQFGDDLYRDDGDEKEDQ